MNAGQPVDLFYHEKQAWQQGQTVAGLDEAGRGAWAGPVVAAVALFHPHTQIAGVNDSKVLTPAKREQLFPQICSEALGYGIGIVESTVIDQINILEATKQAMLMALKQLQFQPDLLLVDGNMKLDVDCPQQAIINGDALSFSIAAASILAKVTRDRLMVALAKNHPEYGFERHKGYGTQIHQEALARVGCSPIHRRSYAPVAQVLKKRSA